ncbi:hypothetical protein ACQJBY_014121 [Aegilops geniculata]
MAAARVPPATPPASSRSRCRPPPWRRRRPLRWSDLSSSPGAPTPARHHHRSPVAGEDATTTNTTMAPQRCLESSSTRATPFVKYLDCGPIPSLTSSISSYAAISAARWTAPALGTIG